MLPTLAELTTDLAHCKELFEQHGCFVVGETVILLALPHRLY